MVSVSSGRAVSFFLSTEPLNRCASRANPSEVHLRGWFDQLPRWNNRLRRTEDVKPGDIFVTSGLGLVSFQVIPVARVLKSVHGLYQEVEVTPIVSSTALKKSRALRKTPLEAGEPSVSGDALPSFPKVTQRRHECLGLGDCRCSGRRFSRPLVDVAR